MTCLVLVVIYFIDSSMKQIPEHAKRVFSGIMFDVRQREQEMFDGSTSIFEAATREHTVCVFATQ